MNKQRIKYSIFLFILFGFQDVFGQSASAVPLVAKYAKDSVVLRWAPINEHIWNALRGSSIVVERSLFAKDSSQILKEPFEKLSSKIKCMDLEEMKRYLGPKSEYGAIAAQAIYGKEFAPNEGLAKDLKDASIQQKNRFGFAMFAAENDAKVAQALGLRFVDKTAKPNHYYIYRIYNNSSDNSLKMDTAYVVVSTYYSENEVLLPPLEIVNLENAVKLKWDAAAYENAYSGYFIEKRKKGTNSWIQLNKKAMVRILNEENPNAIFFYTDSLEQNYVEYEYRLLGINSFAERVASPIVFTGYGKDLTPPIEPEVINVESTPEYFVKINWKKDTKELDFAGFHVQKAYAADGPFGTITEKILPKNTTSFIDKDFNPFLSNHYRIVAVDTANNAAVSLSIYGYFPDSIAPAIPQKPSGTINEKGITTLKWILGNEKDIKGYRVYRANQVDHEFINITPFPITDTVFVDTIALNTTTKKIYYKIAAVDYHYNHSEKSNYLELIRPDIVPPGNPVFHDIFVTDTAVLVKWYNSPSNDVLETWLLRQQNNEEIEILSKFDGTKTDQYFDKTVQRNNSYRYFLMAVDYSNLKSDTSHPVDAFIYNNKLRPSVTNLIISKSEKGNYPVLKWNYSSKQQYYYVIYRQNSLGEMVAYKHVDGNANFFEDWDIDRIGEIKYAITVFFNDGTQSEMSEVKSIVLK